MSMQETQPAPTKSLEELCNTLADQLRTLLGKEPNFLARFLSSRADPELRKTLGRIYVDALDALGLKDRIEKEGCGTALSSLLGGFDPYHTGLDAALEVADEFDKILIQCGDLKYVLETLVAESSYTEGTALAWNDVYKDWDAKHSFTNLRDLVEDAATDIPDLTERSRGLLLGLKSARTHHYRRHRARQKMKMNHLWLLVPPLTVLLIAFGVLIQDMDDLSAKEVTLVAIAGATGASIAGTFKLRDELKLGSDLREFTPAILVQPLVGGVAALFLLITVASGLLDFSESSGILGRATLGFVAGFSEPFFLGVTQHIASTANPGKK